MSEKVCVNTCNKSQKQICNDSERLRVELQRIEELKKKYRQKQILDNMLSVYENTAIEFKDDKSKLEWDEWSKKEGGNTKVVVYASTIAKYMQHLILKHNVRVNQIADNVCRLAGKLDDITGFIHTLAINTLASYWKYGDDLVKWHNKKYNITGE